MNEPFTPASDCFAFGMVAFETSSGVTPYSGLNAIQIGMAISRGERPEVPEIVPHDIEEHVIRPCWANEPNDRPTFEQLQDLLS